MTKRTIACYLVMQFLFSLGMSYIGATYVLFLMHFGLNTLEVNLVNVSFFLTRIICEVPTGALADSVGRKKTVMFACIFLAIGKFFYAQSSTFWQFVIAEVLAGIGYTLVSGAFQAWLVDRLKEQKYEGNIAKVFTGERIVNHVAMGIGAIIGAYAAVEDITMPWIMGGYTFLVTLVLVGILMKEDRTKKRGTEIKSIAHGFCVTKAIALKGMQYARSTPAVLFVIILGSIQGFALQSPNMQWQPFFDDMLHNQPVLGYMKIGINVFMLIGVSLAVQFSLLMRKQEHAMNATQMIIGFGLVGTAVLVTNPALSISAFMLHEIGRGLFIPIKDAYLNKHIPSSERATVLSCYAMGNEVGGLFGLLVSGYCALMWGISSMFVISGLAIIVGTAFAMKYMKK